MYSPIGSTKDSYYWLRIHPEIFSQMMPRDQRRDDHKKGNGERLFLQLILHQFLNIVKIFFVMDKVEIVAFHD